MPRIETPPLRCSGPAASEQIAKDIRRFKRNGGRVERLPGFGTASFRPGDFVYRDAKLQEQYTNDAYARRNAKKTKCAVVDDLDDFDE